MRKNWEFSLGVYLPSIPSIPPIIPMMKPAMKPPPNIRLITAAGNTTTLPIVPYPSIISTEPIAIITPSTKPITTSIHGGNGPKTPIHGNMPFIVL